MKRNTGDAVRELDELAMRFETAVIPLPAGDYWGAFCECFEIRNRNMKLIPSPTGFRETLREVCGYDVWEPIAGKTESLFGLPKRVMLLEDDRALRAELEGPEGLAPFFFVFDLMFCEYEDGTLCFLSGSNN